MTVQGVGAKAALAIMGALGADGLNRSISIGDWAAVVAKRYRTKDGAKSCK